MPRRLIKPADKGEDAIEVKLEGVPFCTYRGHDVRVTPRGWFATRLKGSEHDTNERTYEELQKRIDSYFTQIMKSRKLELPVVFESDEGPKQVVVTGINLHTEALTGLGKSKHGYFYSSGKVYPDVPWIVDRLERKARLQAAIYELDKLLAPYGIDMTWRPVWNGDIPHDYGERLTKLEEVYQQKREMAEDAQ